MAIAQTQTEQIIRPIITDLTSQCACQNKLNNERSEELSPGSRSVGFIGSPRSAERCWLWRSALMLSKGIRRAALRSTEIPENARRNQPSTSRHGHEFLCKRDQTRAPEQLCRNAQLAPIVVKSGLPRVAEG